MYLFNFLNNFFVVLFLSVLRIVQYSSVVKTFRSQTENRKDISLLLSLELISPTTLLVKCRRDGNHHYKFFFLDLARIVIFDGLVLP